MKVKIHPSKNKPVALKMPTSKSMAHRAIICAALAKGKSRISGVYFSEDVKVMAQAMAHLGAKIVPDGQDIVIEGIQDFKHFDHQVIDCGESGSALRFSIPLFSLTDEKVLFQGHGKLMDRPLSVYKDIFDQQGLLFDEGVDTLVIEGKLRPGRYEVPGDISSQFITGLLTTLPLLEDDSYIKVIPPFESSSYVQMTLSMLSSFGIVVEWVDPYTMKIKGNQEYHASDVVVEGDYSQMAFFAALGCINHGIEIKEMHKDSYQGDKAIVSILKAMGAKLKDSDQDYVFEPSKLTGTTIDLRNCPDLGPILFALASVCEGECNFIHCERLRMKESDRISAMQQELRKLGVSLVEEEEYVKIKGVQRIHPTEELDGHKDHRVVMALSILATVSDTAVVIDGVEAVNKSYPHFFEDLKKTGIEIELI